MGFSGKLLRSEFNSKAAQPLPESAFCAYLDGKFGGETAQRVVAAFSRMGLPLPEGREEFLDGTEGALVFLSRYGLVLRIENLDSAAAAFKGDRINDSPWILQPLASIDAGKAIIEICPGCHLEEDFSQVQYLCEQLLRQNIAYFDYGVSNNGRLPFTTPEFPEGVPVVIDRLAVRKLTAAVRPVGRALDLATRQAAEAQEKLYGGLRAAFSAGWDDAKKMRGFWELCEVFLREGKLVAGWEESDRQVRHPGDPEKPGHALKAAKSYGGRLKPGP